MFRRWSFVTLIAGAITVTCACGGDAASAGAPSAENCTSPSTPHISSVNPTVLQQFVSGQTIVVRGDTFAQDSRIEIQGSALVTLFFSAGELHATVPVELVNFRQQLSVRVVTFSKPIDSSSTDLTCHDSAFTRYSGFLYIDVQ